MDTCGPGLVWYAGRCVLPKSRPTLGWHAPDADDVISAHVIAVYEQELIPDPDGVRNLRNMVDSIRPARRNTAREN